LLQEKGIPFKIQNTSNATITDVRFSTSEKLASTEFDSIASNQNEQGFLNMKENKTDGAYTLVYFRENGTKVETSAGYYTSGVSMDNYIRFEIKNDTTLVKFGKFPN